VFREKERRTLPEEALLASPHFPNHARMAVRETYREFVVEQLGRVRPVTWRKMFGGVGIYAGDAFFALLDNDTLYFKTGDANRADFEARGMKPFRPFGPDTKPMGYHEVPADVLEKVTELEVWLGKAVAVAEAQGSKPQSRKRKTTQARVSPKARGV
jgi:DNA transformation protein and related proteins